MAAPARVAAAKANTTVNIRKYLIFMHSYPV
ncbi:hypothetical protein ACP_2740 [Acidobacterium capsulatum ATCC 51196]|uniref:Uncharacterized protein n=1 Tax=Acidobacterium capsulatum (strain ATCC 51196 / DSM 11244 / BCRC 80197 / JCM 7670 / NBRC 15755 / NCIMB 13165 / 161) TaxID=240015 RepID=C1F348_ACIC5|nr:hypothetical protein ACP_2740 [Acidobacterium capsulatum ATCC 51196]